jgi:zinc transporter ZupT
MNKRKKTLLLILAAVAVLLLLATAITCFTLRHEKPWLAFYLACAGGCLIANILLSMVLIHKNIK